MGARNEPHYRIVVANQRSPRDGRFIEIIGTYHPGRAGVNYTIKLDRAQYWIGKGAQPSQTVASILKKAAKAGPAEAAPEPAPAPAAPSAS